MMASNFGFAVLMTILVFGRALEEATGRPLGSQTNTTKLNNYKDLGDFEDEGVTIPSFLRDFVSSLDPEKIKQYGASLEDNTLGEHGSEFCKDAKLDCDSGDTLEAPNMGASEEVDEDDEMFQYIGNLDDGDQSVSFGEKDIIKGQDVVFAANFHASTFSSPSFLPQSLAEKMPFSSEKIRELLDSLHISYNSKLANMMSHTVSRCELTKEKSSKETMISKEKEMKEGFEGTSSIEKEKAGKENKFDKEKSGVDEEITSSKEIKEKEIEVKREKSSKEKKIKKKEIERNTNEGIKSKYGKGKKNNDKEIKDKELEAKEFEEKELELKKEKSSKEKVTKKKDFELKKDEEIKEKYGEEKDNKNAEMRDKEFEAKERDEKELDVKHEKSSKGKELKKKDFELEKDEEIKGEYGEGQGIKEKEIKDKEFEAKELDEKELESKKEKSSKETKIKKKEFEMKNDEEKGKYGEGKGTDNKEIKDKEFQAKDREEKELVVKKENSSKGLEIKKGFEDEEIKGRYIGGKGIKEEEIKDKEFEKKEFEVKKEKSSKEKEIKTKDFELKKAEGIKGKHGGGKGYNDLEIKDVEFEAKEFEEKELEVKKEKLSKEKEIKKKDVSDWNEDKDMKGTDKEKVIKEKEIEVKKEKSSKETLKCVISLEGMTSFVKKSLPAEKHIKALETSCSSKLGGGDGKKAHWKVFEVKKHDKAVVCRKEVFLFAVFKCHTMSKTKGMQFYHIKLKSEDGVQCKEVLACADRKKLKNSQLGKARSASESKPLCRWITDSLVWVPRI